MGETRWHSIAFRGHQALVAGCLASVLACSGELGDEIERGPRDAPLPGGPTGLPPGQLPPGQLPPGQSPPGQLPPELQPETVRAMDDAMRAADPALFEVAMRHFPGELASPAPTRLARLTHRQLDLTTRALLPNLMFPEVASVLPRDPLQTNYEYADHLGFNAANFTPYLTWSSGVATDAVSGAPFGCSDATGAGSCDMNAVRAFVARAFRQAGTPEQLDRYVALFAASAAAVGPDQASKELVELVLTDPAYVFRDEVTLGPTGALLDPQRLQSLTYTLTDAPPFALGLTLADGSAGALDDDLLMRVLSDPRARDKLARFFVAWLEVKEPDEFTIADAVFPEFTPALAEAMVAETDAFLRHQLEAVAPSLKSITQSTESFVSGALAEIYGVRPNRDPNGLTQLDPNERFGILTQPAVITSHSGPSTTRLVKRGVFFTRKIMCIPLGAPPPGVDTTIPPDAGRTERERIEAVTNQPTCLGCHAYINPFGFMQESFDPIGRFVTETEGERIDPAVMLDLFEEGVINAQTTVEALSGLTNSMRFQQCFVRQLFRYYLGRDERTGDDPVLRQMFFAFARDGQQDMLAALRVLAGSTVMTHRMEAM